MKTIAAIAIATLAGANAQEVTNTAVKDAVAIKGKDPKTYGPAIGPGITAVPALVGTDPATYTPMDKDCRSCAGAGETCVSEDAGDNCIDGYHCASYGTPTEANGFNGNQCQEGTGNGGLDNGRRNLLFGGVPAMLPCCTPSVPDEAAEIAKCNKNSGSTGYSWCLKTTPNACLRAYDCVVSTPVVPDEAAEIAKCNKNSGSTGYSWCLETTPNACLRAYECVDPVKAAEDKAAEAAAAAKAATDKAAEAKAAEIAKCTKDSGSTGYSWCLKTTPNACLRAYDCVAPAEAGSGSA